MGWENKYKAKQTAQYANVRSWGPWGAGLTIGPVSGEQRESFLWQVQHIGRWGKERNVSQTEGRIGRTCLFWQFSSFSCAPPVVCTPADFLTWW